MTEKTNYEDLLREKLEAEWPDEEERQAVDEYEEERRRLNDQYWYW